MSAPIMLLLAAEAQKAYTEAEAALRAAGALTPAQARTLDELGLGGSGAIETLREAGIVKAVDAQQQVLPAATPAHPNLRYYLDEAAVAAAAAAGERSAQRARRIVPWILVIAVAVVIFLAFIVPSRGS